MLETTYELIYTNKVDNPDEVDKVLKIHKLSKLTPRRNRKSGMKLLITSKQTDLVI